MNEIILDITEVDYEEDMPSESSCVSGGCSCFDSAAD